MLNILEQGHFCSGTFVGSCLTLSKPRYTCDKYRDLSGETWVVTGATGGIGFALAKLLVMQDAHVWIVGRSEAKLIAVAQKLRAAKRSAEVDYIVIDYNDLATVKPGAAKLLHSTTRLNGIIHNAGVMNALKGSTTKQGFEQHLGVNNLAPQLLQDLLDPLIQGTPGARILWMSSSAHTTAPANGYDFSRIRSRVQWTLYGQSKALNIIQAAQWTRKHPQSPVKALTVYPGVIKSDLWRTTHWIQRAVMSLVQSDIERASLAAVFAALSPDAENNAYIVPWGRPGTVRPDVDRAAHSLLGEKADAWIEVQIEPYK